jgi:hypothetical protein
VGDNGTILKTINGGENWISQTIGTTNYLSGVSFKDAFNGIVVGNYGTILKTTNGGETWQAQSGGTTNSLTDVSFSDANNVTIVGYEGIILRTKNGGTNWQLQTSGTSNTLRGVSFSDAYNGTAVGDGGTILRTTNGGVTFIGKENSITNPQEFNLSQNYPNPFNPSTTIKYSIPKQSDVTIKVYNILGKEILTLVNENKLQGNYTIEFNANNLASGVYFYQLKTNNFIQTKKMLLMK